MIGEHIVATTGERLKCAMEYRHTTAAEISKATGISRGSLSQYIRGKFSPKQDRIYILANHLRVSPAWLMGLDVDMESKVPHDKKLYVNTACEKNDYKEALEFIKHSIEKELQETDKTPSNGSLFKDVPMETAKIPIIASVKCGYNGYAYEYQEGSVFIDGESYHGNIKAFRCYGDSMSGIGIFDGDIAIVRIQDDIENGELAIVVIDNEESTLKRVRKQEGAIILESANPAYPSRVFTGESMNALRIIGKVVEIRRRL